MPRKPKSAVVNRSQAIRDHLAKSPNASLAEIKESLSKNGIEVSDSLIGAVKYKHPKRKKRRKRGRKAGSTARAASADSVSIDTLIAAKQLVDRLGGVDAAAKAIAVLKKLQE